MPVQRQLLFDGEEKDLIAQRLPAQTGAGHRIFHRHHHPVFSSIGKYTAVNREQVAFQQHIASDAILGFQLPVATIAFPWRCAADIIVSGTHCAGTQADRRIETERPAATDLLMQTAEIEALLILLWGQWGYQRLIINVINHQPGVVLRRRHVIQTLVHVGQLSDKCRIVR